MSLVCVLKALIADVKKLERVACKYQKNNQCWFVILYKKQHRFSFRKLCGSFSVQFFLPCNSVMHLVFYCSCYCCWSWLLCKKALFTFFRRMIQPWWEGLKKVMHEKCRVFISITTKNTSKHCKMLLIKLTGKFF